MIFKEFGNKEKPVIMFLHGGGLSWWSWKPHIEALKEEYYVVTPIIDGHGEDWNTPFISIEDSAEKIINYIKEKHNGKIYALCGLSIGAQITVEILSRESSITENSVIESALVYPIRGTVALTKPMYNLFYGLIKKRWFSRLQAKALYVPEKLFDKYYEESSNMTKESLINMTESNGNYSLPTSICNTEAKVLILVGEKEISIMRKSAVLLHDSIKGSELKIIPKSGHGEISLINSDEYIKLILEFFKR